MEKSSNKILLTVLGIAVLVVATIGATFAYFTATASTAEKTVKTGQLIVKSATLGDIAETNIKPTSFTAGAENTDVAKSVLTVDTTGTTVTGARYDIVLNASLAGVGETVTGGGSAADVKYALYDANNTQALATGDFSEAALATGKVIKTVDIATAGSTTYNLYIYVADNGEQNSLQNVTATAQVTVNATTEVAAQG